MQALVAPNRYTGVLGKSRSASSQPLVNLAVPCVALNVIGVGTLVYSNSRYNHVDFNSDLQIHLGSL